MQPTNIARTIGTKVRARRKRIGMTRKQLAAAAGVSERYLNELENGEANASVAILAKVAEALGLQLASLLVPEDHDAIAQAAARRHAGLASLIDSMSLAEQSGALPVLERYLDGCRRATKGIALLGLRGAGKSTLGRRLAERHGLPFVSVTREIELRAGMGLADLFNLGGPDAYRAFENEVVAALIGRAGGVVVETAGGIVGNREALDMILASFRTVWLKALPEEHLARVAEQGDTRPMHGSPQALEHVKALLVLREPEYARADAVIDTSGRSIDACLADLEAFASPLIAMRAA